MATLHFLTACIYSRIPTPLILLSCTAIVSGYTGCVLLVGHHFDSPPLGNLELLFDSIMFSHTFVAKLNLDKRNRTVRLQVCHYYTQEIVYISTKRPQLPWKHSTEAIRALERFSTGYFKWPGEFVAGLGVRDDWAKAHVSPCLIVE